MRLKLLYTIFLLLILQTNGFGKATKTWNRTTGGVWTTAANWTPSGQPANGDNIIINTNQSAAITNIPARSLLSLNVSGTCNLQSDADGSLQFRTITVTTSSFSADSDKPNATSVITKLFSLNYIDKIRWC